MLPDVMHELFGLGVGHSLRGISIYDCYATIRGRNWSWGVSCTQHHLVVNNRIFCQGKNKHFSCCCVIFKGDFDTVLPDKRSRYLFKDHLIVTIHPLSRSVSLDV